MSRICSSVVGSLAALGLIIGLTGAPAQAETNVASDTALSPNVVGGSDIPISDAPWQVVLRRNGFFACGGVILDAQTVLTAAHCVEDFESGSAVDPSVVSIGYGSALRTATTNVDAASITVHPGYEFDGGSEYDAAVVKLAEPIALSSGTAESVTLPTAAPGGWPANDDSAAITGWGRTVEDTSVVPEQLQGAEVRIIADCAGTSIDDPALQLCAGLPQGGIDTCAGDSGGPLMVDDSLAGLTSFGTGCARPNLPGGYTRVTAILDWVEAQLLPDDALATIGVITVDGNPQPIAQHPITGDVWAIDSRGGTDDLWIFDDTFTSGSLTGSATFTGLNEVTDIVFDSEGNAYIRGLRGGKVGLARILNGSTTADDSLVTAIREVSVLSRTLALVGDDTLVTTGQGDDTLLFVSASDLTPYLSVATDDTPLTIAVDPTQRVYLTSGGAARDTVGIYASADGSPVGSLSNGSDLRVRPMTVGSDGSLFAGTVFGTQDEQYVSKWPSGATSGSATARVDLANFPNYMTTGGDGDIYATHQNNARVFRVSSASTTLVDQADTDTRGCNRIPAPTQGATYNIAGNQVGITYMPCWQNSRIVTLHPVSAETDDTRILDSVTDLTVTLTGLPDGVIADDTTVEAITVGSSRVTAVTSLGGNRYRISAPSGTGFQPVSIELAGGNVINAGTVERVALGSGLTPETSAPLVTADGAEFQITNYDAAWTWTQSATNSGDIQIGTANGSDLVSIVSGLAASTSSTVTIDTTRQFFADDSLEFTITAATAGALASAPTLAAPENGNARVDIPWSIDDTGTAGITHIQWSLDDTFAWIDDSVAASGLSGTLPITGLTNGTTYQVYVRAINANGASAWSTPVSVTPVAPQPPTPPAPVPPGPVPPPPPIPPEPQPQPVPGPVPPGQGQAVINGEPAQVTVTADPQTAQVRLAAGTAEITFGSRDASGDQVGLGEGNSLVLPPGGALGLDVRGLAPDSTGEVLFSPEPLTTTGVSLPGFLRTWITTASDDSMVTLASFTVDGEGAVDDSVVISDDLAEGPGILQIAAVDSEDQLISVFVGVTVADDAVVEPTIMITGTRGEVRGRPGVRVLGETTGLVGATVMPRFRFPGPTGYADGVARRTVGEDGTFTWQRRTGKKIYVIFTTEDSSVASKRIIIRGRR